MKIAFTVSPNPVVFQRNLLKIFLENMFDPMNRKMPLFSDINTGIDIFSIPILLLPTGIHAIPAFLC